MKNNTNVSTHSRSSKNLCLRVLFTVFSPVKKGATWFFKIFIKPPPEPLIMVDSSHDNDKDVVIRPGWEFLNQDDLKQHPHLLVVSGFRRQKRMWVISYLQKNQPQTPQEPSGDPIQLKEPFFLAFSILVIGLRSILGQTRVALYKELYHKYGIDQQNHQGQVF